jgi:hypothetical protein
MTENDIWALDAAKQLYDEARSGDETEHPPPPSSVRDVRTFFFSSGGPQGYYQFVWFWMRTLAREVATERGQRFLARNRAFATDLKEKMDQWFDQAARAVATEHGQRWLAENPGMAGEINDHLRRRSEQG